jgi:PAS domain S-box-containing protein
MESSQNKLNEEHSFAERRFLFTDEHSQTCGYYSLFEQATDALMVTDLNGKILEVNSSLCQMLGYSKKELLSMRAEELVEQNDVMKNPIPYELLIAGENTFRERKVVHKNGNIIYFDVNAKRCGPDQILVIARNITDRKITEENLQKSQANLRTIFENTETIYVLLDKKSRVISYNSRACDFAEKELRHTIEKSEYFLDYVSPEQRSTLQQYLGEVLLGKHIQYTVSYPQGIGTANWYNVRLFPISNKARQVEGVMMEVADITEKVLLERQLEQERYKQQRIVTDAVITAEENERQQIGQELHDNVNQILATARLYIGLAKQTEMRKHLPIISKADKLIDYAINEIRNLSHSLITPFLDEYGLAEAIDHLAGSISSASMIPISKRIDIDETKTGKKLNLTIYRIIQEQLTNIIKHSKATSVLIELTQNNNSICLSIKDNGVGFDTAKTVNGVGLKNIRTRAALFNGEMDIFSHPGGGCALWIEFAPEQDKTEARNSVQN